MGIEIRKQSINGFAVKHQTPSPRIEVYTARNPNTPDIIYEAETKNRAYSKLLSYTFAEATDDLLGSFSFSVENDVIGSSGKTTFDAIPKMSVVKIFEANAKEPSFVGIVKRKKFRSSMSAQGVRRSIMFSGKSIISVMAEYAVSLDFRIADTAYVGKLNTDLTTKLAEEELSIKKFMVIIWEHFKQIGANSPEASATAVGKIIDDFLGSPSDFISTGSTDASLHYNIASVFYNQAVNIIGDVWRNILPDPVYEIFSYVERKTGKPQIMAREVPFGFPGKNTDWKDLDVYEVDPVDLISYEVTNDDDEVYTVFKAYLLGSAESQEFYMAVEQQANLVKNTEKHSLYGYKPLMLTFRGYDKSDIKKGQSAASQAMETLNKKTAYWYGRLDDMLDGVVVLCTDFSAPKNGEKDRNPRVGNRLRFLGAEFYINRAEHKWDYGGTPTITLSISRGMKYEADGTQAKGDAGLITGIGKRRMEVE